MLELARPEGRVIPQRSGSGRPSRVASSNRPAGLSETPIKDKLSYRNIDIALPVPGPPNRYEREPDGRPTVTGASW
jgi:hypothetical protein